MFARSFGLLGAAALLSGSGALAQQAQPMAADPATATPAATAPGAAAPPAGYADIVVTAQRRSESLQKVPASITAIGATEIANARIEGALDLQRVSPSVNVSTYFGSVQINIRGLGLTSPNPDGEPSVLTYIDGVYIARPTAIGAAFEDLERIEVLRGPQGTLYGRNATGGVVNLLTRTPGDELTANVSATYGRYDRVKITGGVEGPLAEGTSARLSFYHDSHGADQFNIYSGKKVRDFNGNGVRGTIVSEVTDKLTLTLRGDYYKDKIKGVNYDEIEGSESAGANSFGSTASNPSGFFPVATVPARGPLANDGKNVSFNAINPLQGHENWGTSLTGDWKLSDDISLKSITSYRRSFLNRDRQDYDGTSASIIEENYARETSRAFTQEFDLGGETAGGTNWVVGAYYFHENTDLHYRYQIFAQALLADYAFGLPPGSVPNTFKVDQTGKTQSVSAFGQATVPISDSLKLTAGLRKNFDKKRQVQDIVVFGNDLCGGPGIAKGKWNDLTWKIGLDYQISRNSMVYATVSRGFKAGGLNLSACTDTYDPENVISYEVGTKNTFFDGKLLVNMSGFYYDYTDLQVNVFTATTTITQNSSSARVYGLEFESKLRPIENLEIGGNFSLLHAEYRGYTSQNPLLIGTGAAAEDLTGNRIANAPKFIAQAVIDYTIPVGDNEIGLRYDIRHNSGFFGDAFHNFGSRQKAYEVMNARAVYRFGNYQIGGFVDNLANKIYAENRFTFGTGGNVLAIWAPRRTWGIFATAKY